MSVKPERMIVFRMSPELHKAFKAHCATKGKSMTKVVTEMITKEVESHCTYNPKTELYH